MLIQNSTIGASTPNPSVDSGGASLSAPVGSTQAPGSSTSVELPQHAVSQAGATSSAQYSNSQLQAAVDKLNNAMGKSNVNLTFSIDKNTKQTVIKVIDSKTGETVKQFPSEEAIAISKAIDQFQKGLLIRQQA